MNLQLICVQVPNTQEFVHNIRWAVSEMFFELKLNAIDIDIFNAVLFFLMELSRSLIAMIFQSYCWESALLFKFVQLTNMETCMLKINWALVLHFFT